MYKLEEYIKENYENRTRYYLPRKSYTILRIDGKNFSKYTKRFEKPFDQGMIDDMVFTARYLCEEIQGAFLAYTQSDEISIAVCDFMSQNSEAWYDGNLQKMASISASKATSAFNQSRIFRLWKDPQREFSMEECLQFAAFDSRVFTMPSKDEVEKYFIWRQKDCIRNSVSMTAQSIFSHKELQKKSTREVKEMLLAKDAPWEAQPENAKFGLVVSKVEEVKDITFTKSNGEVETKKGVKRKVWTTKVSPVFTEDRSFLNDIIPNRRVDEENI